MDIKELFDSLPDHEDLLEFDPFLVGEGSKSFMSGDREKTNNQLTGVFSTEDLKNSFNISVNFGKDSVSDLSTWKDQFSVVKVDVLPLFLSEKRRSYELFDYLRVKSEGLSSLVREEDLLISESDTYLLDYLSDKFVLDKYLVCTLAQLSAWRDMGVREVKFYSNCDCALCRAADRVVYQLQDLFHGICSGSFPTHEFCDCYYLPVIRSREESFLIPEIEINGTLYKNFPCEFKYLVDSFYSKVKTIEFMDFTKVKGWSGECVLNRGSSLAVHWGYIGNFSPLDFLEFWLSDGENGSSSEDILYYKGRKVQLINGSYIDVATGEFVEV